MTEDGGAERARGREGEAACHRDAHSPSRPLASSVLRPPSFVGLRLRLTVLYLLAALALGALVGGSTYGLLRYYFETTTDLALRRKMALELQVLGAPVPPELVAAVDAWSAGRSQLLSRLAAAPQADEDRRGGDDSRRRGREAEGRRSERDDDDDGGRRRRGRGEDDHLEIEEAYDGELAAIFVLPLSKEGRIVLPPGLPGLPSGTNPQAAGAGRALATFSVGSMAPDPQAVAAALAQGSDLRTARLDSGARMRLLTYRVTGGEGPALLQLGRVLADQDRLMGQLLLGLLGLGGASTVLLGAGSWWLAGRSLFPAQQAWERQQAFVANASHELRAPLTLMRASAEVALRQVPAADADQRALLGDVLQECDHMARLVEDLLLLSRLDAGRLALQRQAVSLPELFADMERQVGRLAEERQVHLAAHASGGAAWADPTRLRQVLLILLDNALRHTPPGGSVLLEASPQGRQVHLLVSDTGSGIAPEHLPHVFDRFYRANGARGADRGGSGLGLAIAKALVEAQQGEIRLSSRPGQGTRVEVVLPNAYEVPRAATISRLSRV